LKKGFKASALLLIALMLVMGAVLAACGKQGNLAGEQVFKVNISTEPPSLDPGTAIDSTSFAVLVGMYEGLTRLDEEGNAVKAIAKDWTVSDDGLTWTFKLRDDVKWTNGDPVTAHNFEYAWKRALDPALASQYAYQLYYIKGAEAYNAGENTDKDSIGVKAQDDHTLVVELNAPTPYFTSLTAFFTYYPLNENAIGGVEDWFADASTMVSNGPFKLAEWKHNDSIRLVKNPDYYAAEDIKLEEVRMTMVDDAATELSMYQTGQIDWNGSPNGEVPLDLIPTLKQQNKLHIKGKASIYYYAFNVQAKPFDNAKVRKALSMAINRKDIVEKITQADQIPAYGVVTPGIIGDSKTFREEFKDTDYFKEDYAEAKKLLQEGLAESGMDKLPETTLLYNTSDGHKKIAQAVVGMWKDNLGIDVKLENQEWQVFLNTRQQLDYQIARAGWGADYNDPMTYLDMYTTTSGNNDIGFSNKEYDKLIADALKEPNSKKRMELMAKAEQLLFEQEMPIVPLYYYTSVWQQNEKVKNVIIDFAGNMDYTRGYIEK